MHSVKHFLQEIHRRSVWQVVGIYLATSWAVLNAVDVLTGFAGLPDWTPTMAVVLLLIGFPIVTATAVIQKGLPGVAEKREPDDEGHTSASPDTGSEPNLAAGTGSLDRPTTRPSSSRRLFTWRNAVMGGLGAFALLGMSLVAYFVMWQTGIGSVGNLEAQGVFEEGEAIVLADFANSSSDASLGSVVTEALRVDLASSRAITLVSTAYVGSVLDLMQREGGAGLSAAVAREVAIRGGIKAVIDGDVGSAGSGYILTAAIRSAESGEPLKTFRRTAGSADEVIAAIDGLSQDIREAAGESLRSIKGEAGLASVTTSSLEALRLFSQVEGLVDRGEDARALEVLEEVLELDPAFAMAWRKLSAIARTTSPDPTLEVRAATRAYELRDRLTPLERLYATAYYHDVVSGDSDASIRAYEAVLVDYPGDSRSLNNIAIQYFEMARWEEAIEYLSMAVETPEAASTELTNLGFAYVALGRPAEARGALAELESISPDDGAFKQLLRWNVAVMDGDLDGALGIARRMQVQAGIPVRFQTVGATLEGVTLIRRGEWDEALRPLEASQQRVLSGEPQESVRAALNIALFHHFAVGDDAAGVERLGEVLDAGTLRDAAPLAIGYRGLVRGLVMLGDAGRARALLEEWKSSGAAGSATEADEWVLAVEAVEASEVDDRIGGIDRYRARTQCSRCLGWEYAELLEEAGRPGEAIEAYHGAMAAQPFNGFPGFQVVIRVFGHERLAALYDELGDTAQAVEHYSLFADAFESPDDVLGPRVQRARARIDELSR